MSELSTITRLGESRTRWDRQRFGLYVHTSLAAVPAWAPIGASPDWYRPHLEGPLPDLLHEHVPLLETVTHHRDTWPSVDRFEDFLPHLTFDEFDASEWTTLARDAGMSYAVMTAKHYDGLCWWDAPATEFSVCHHGPRRNVLAEFRDACAEIDLSFGVSYSLLDWHDPAYPNTTFVDEVIHPQVVDLAERYAPDVMWIDGQWGAGSTHWRSDELLTAARSRHSNFVHNERWWAAEKGVRTFENTIPDKPLTQPWETRWGMSNGFGHNSAATPDHLMSPTQIVALLTEVIAKGGHLLLGIGPDAQGRLLPCYADRLRTVGGWVRRHQDLINRGQPWVVWGDATTRYLTLDGELYAVDIDGKGHLPGLARVADRITAVTTTDGQVFDTDRSADGVRVKRAGRPRTRLPQVYRIELKSEQRPSVELFSPPTQPIRYLVDELADAKPGDVVQLGDGVYQGPARVPDGVTVRGLGPDRTTIGCPDRCVVVLGDGARLEHCTVASDSDRIVWVPQMVVRMVGTNSRILGCHVEGHVMVKGDDARIRSSHVTGVVSQRADRVQVVRCTLTGMNWNHAIRLHHGNGHLIDGNHIEQFLSGVHLFHTGAATVRGNTISVRWWAVRLVDTEGTLVSGNWFTRMTRPVDIDGGADIVVKGNAADLTDSGCVVQRGATGVRVSGNRWSRTRVGLVCWDAGEVNHSDNKCERLGEPGCDIVTAP